MNTPERFNSAGKGSRREKRIPLILTAAAVMAGAAGVMTGLRGGAFSSGGPPAAAGKKAGGGGSSGPGPRETGPGGAGPAAEVTREKRTEVEAGCLKAMALAGRLPRLGAEPSVEQVREMREMAEQWLSETGEGGRWRRKLEDWIERDARNREPGIASLEAHLWGTETAEVLENAYTQMLMGDFLMKLFSSPENFLAAAPEAGAAGSVDSFHESRFGKVRGAKPPLREWVRILDAVVNDRLTSSTAPGTDIDEPAAGRETAGQTGSRETADGTGQLSEQAGTFRKPGEAPEKDSDEPPEEMIDFLRDEIRAMIMLNLGAE